VTTKVEKSVVVDAPLTAVYNQWTQFEEFPRFMSGIEQITQLEDDRLEWVASIAGVKRRWTARILEQVPDTRVAWAAIEGATNAGAVTFNEAGPNRTEVHLTLEYEPEGVLEALGDKLHIVEKQAKVDLERFKEFMESHPRATGGWRGSVGARGAVGTPGVEDAASSFGDSGKVDEGVTHQPGGDAAPSGFAAPPAGGYTPLRGDRPLNATDAAAGFGDPDREVAPGVVRDPDHSQ